jgi:hypothetical protein
LSGKEVALEAYHWADFIEKEGGLRGVRRINN